MITQQNRVRVNTNEEAAENLLCETMDVAERRSGAVSRWMLCAVSLLLLLMVHSSVQEGESIASYGGS